jgi:NADH dehydrogenase
VSATSLHRVVVVGGGFGGLYAARALRRAPVELTLIDRRNFHLFQPLLYQVATGGLSPGDITSPLRYVLRGNPRAHVILDEVVEIDAGGRRVIGRRVEIDYDTLILATGARHHYFGRGEWESRAPGLKTVEDAIEIRRRIFSAFEAAEIEADARRQEAWLTFVIVGAGPTGVELAGALAEIARETLRRDFRRIDPRRARIFLLEGAARVLPAYPEELSRRAENDLEKLGVTVRTGALVTEVAEDGVTMRVGEESGKIEARTVLWAAGVEASRLGRIVAERTAAPLDRAGRVIVEPDLSLPGHPEIFVIGDLAHFAHQGGAALPGVAPVAMQEGRYVAETVRRRLRGEPSPPFRYADKGTMATIGRHKAVAQIGPLRFGGPSAWLAWLFIHLLYLVEFENRLLVLVQWSWNYLTWNRGARLITTGEAQE